MALKLRGRGNLGIRPPTRANHLPEAPWMELGPALIAGVIGLVAGLLGGLAGIGGSMVMLPGLALLLGYDDQEHSAQHLYMAAAMCVNVLVSFPAAVQHRKEGAVRMDLVRLILPAMIVGIVAGVLLSDRIGGEALKLGLAAFIALYCVFNLYRIATRSHLKPDVPERTAGPVLVAIGTAAGFVGGVLGLGGGAVMVPMLQMIARVRLRTAIGTSAAVMWISASVGAAIKLATLHEHHRTLAEAGMLVLALGPMAMLGGLAGAWLAHRLPLPAVRLIITVLLLIAAARMAGLP